MGEQLGRALIGRLRPTRIDPQRRRTAINVAQAAGGGLKIYPGRKQLGGIEMPEVLQRLGDIERGNESL